MVQLVLLGGIQLIVVHDYDRNSELVCMRRK